MGPDAMIFVFWMLSFKPTFSFSSFTFIKRLFSSLLSAIMVVSSAYLRLLIFLPAILILACASSSLAFLKSSHTNGKQIQENRLNITNQGNTDQDCEISPHPCEKDFQKRNVLARMWRKRKLCVQLVRRQIGAVTMENSMEDPTLPQEKKKTRKGPSSWKLAGVGSKGNKINVNFIKNPA